MHNFASISPGRSQVSSVELFRLWDVDEDRAYQIKRVWDKWDGPGSSMPTEGRHGLCAARTISGEGWFQTRDGARQALAKNSLIVLPWAELDGWGTAGQSWRFYWLEFFAEPSEPLVLREPVQVPCPPSEREEVRAIQSQIRSPLLPTRCIASARFSVMLYRWLEIASLADDLPQSHAQIDKALELMHSQVHRPLTVSEMAGQAGMASRSFATVFEQVTGQTPKRYHLDLRLDAARALLLSGRANVKQAAQRLGFSSPFYLSKLYHKRYGHPPSQAH